MEEDLDVSSRRMVMEEDGEAAELTEKEWREMRRRMTSLKFDPVPETPELLPRSCYGAEDPGDEKNSIKQDDAEEQEDEEGMATPFNDMAMLEDVTPAETTDLDPVDALAVEERSAPLRNTRKITTNSQPPTPRSSAPKKIVKSPDPRGSSVRRSSSGSPVKKVTKRTSSSSASLSSTIGQSPPSAGVDISELESVITSAQDQLRVSVLAAVQATIAQHEREATLARRKLEATHANTIALLQHQCEELQAQHLHCNQRALEDADLLERVSRLLQRVKHRHHNHHSLRACFQGWRRYMEDKKHRRKLETLAAAVSRSHAQQLVLQQWKLGTQRTVWAEEKQAMAEQHRQEVEELRAQSSAREEQFQHELEDAQRETQVAQRQRQQLEGDLRQVFLRGVTAMNLEALTLFKTKSVVQTSSPQAEEPPNQLEQTEDPRFHGEEGGVEAAIPATGEQSAEEELPSEERMIPVKSPAVAVEDPRSRLLSARPPAEGTFMASSVMASKMLKRAGTPACEVVPDVLSTPPPPPAPPTAAIHGLRSAELVEAHQRLLHATTQNRRHQLFQPHQHQLYQPKPTGASLSPVQQRLKAQSSTQFHVEMEYVRSAVASAAATSSSRLRSSPSPTTRSFSSVRRSTSPLVSGPSSYRSFTGSSVSASSKSRWRGGI